MRSVPINEFLISLHCVLRFFFGGGNFVYRTPFLNFDIVVSVFLNCYNRFHDLSINIFSCFSVASRNLTRLG